MNGRDVDDVLEILSEERESKNRSKLKYQRKLVHRLRTQIVDRAPASLSTDKPTEQFAAFARWLESRGTLEGSYLTEAEGGQSRVRTLQMTADIVRGLRSYELCRVLSGPHGHYLEPQEWALRELERQLNSWRHLSMDYLPLWIHVDFAPLRIPEQYEKALKPYGDTTLTFTITPNPEQLL